MEDNIQLTKAVLNNTDAGILVVDNDLRIQLWNNWIEKSTGLHSNDVIKKHLYDVYPDLNGSRLLQALYTCVTNGLPSTLSSTLNPHPLPLYRNSLDRSQEHLMFQQMIIKPVTLDGNSMAMLHVLDVTGAVIKEKKL